MVIVTQNQYILAQKIHHITLDEKADHQEVRSNSRYRTVIDRYYQISVIYTPETTLQTVNNNREPELRECSVILRGHLNAHQVFKNLIQQIREQMPDQLYLDKAIEHMIAGTNLDDLKDKDLEDEKQMIKLEAPHDRRSKKVRGARKAKRRNKKVLRRAKRRR